MSGVPSDMPCNIECMPPMQGFLLSLAADASTIAQTTAIVSAKTNIKVRTGAVATQTNATTAQVRAAAAQTNAATAAAA